MKKTLTIVALVLAITVSLIAGTMSYYTTTLENLAGGSVVAKEFILEGEDHSKWNSEVKIAPGEKQELLFLVKNFNEKFVSETDMKVDVQVEVKGSDNKSAIVPLTATINDGSNHEITLNKGEGKGAVGFDAKADKKVERKFVVTIEWPFETEGVNDYDYSGSKYGSTVTVSVTGTQVQLP